MFYILGTYSPKSVGLYCTVLYNNSMHIYMYFTVMVCTVLECPAQIHSVIGCYCTVWYITVLLAGSCTVQYLVYRTVWYITVLLAGSCTVMYRTVW